MQTKSFNIVIYPSQEIIDQAIKVSRQLKKHGGLFVLDNKNYFPHLTVSFVELPLKNLSQVRYKLKILAAKIKPFKITSLNYRQMPPGYTDVNFRKDKKLMDLQKQALKTVGSYRSQELRPRDLEKFKTYTKLQQRNLKLYGFRDVGKNYFPHLSFTRLKKMNPKAFYGIAKKDFSFTVSQIGLFELGEHGTCRKKVEIFKLKNA